MSSSFCKFPQTRFWHEILEHLSALRGVAVTNAADDPVIGSWVDFTYGGHTFTINSESGEFLFFIMDTDCHESVQAEITAYFEAFLGKGTDYGDGSDVTLRRV